MEQNMKAKSLRLAVPVLSLLWYSTAVLATEASAVDISNKVLTCDSSLLAGQPAGACLVAPNGTLFVTVTLEAHENADVLDNLHVVIYSEGRYYEYDPIMSRPNTNLWKEVSNDKLQAKLFTSSFQKMPFETRGIARQIALGDFATKKGAKVFVGVRSNKSSGFEPETVKEVFVIK
jgi:hypothetical protein